MYNTFLRYMIKTIRLYSNFTQKEFGAKIDRSEITVRQYESGKINITFNTLNVIINNIDIDLSMLVDIVDSVKKQLINGKIMSEKELDLCVQQFNDDISKIYNIKDVNMTDIKPAEALKVVFDNQLQEYIYRTLQTMVDDERDLMSILGVDKNTTNKIRTDVMDYLDFKIERLYGFLTMKNK